ncbi:hypothetical protein ScPMuIL_004393 [Solemya velum]
MDKSASRKRKAYTVKDKLFAIDRVHKGESRQKVATDLGVPESTFGGWFKEQRAEGVPISGPILLMQAEKFDKELNGDSSTFKASQGWLMRFKQRHGIGAVTISGEMQSADHPASDTYLKLKEIIKNEGLKPEQVYNCDETGFCHKMLPNKTLASRTDEQKKMGSSSVRTE